MLIAGPVRPGRLIDRPNRFTVRVVIEPEEDVVEAQILAPGQLRDLLVRDARVWLRSVEERGRTRWSTALVQPPGGGLVCLDETSAVELVGAAIREELLPELAGLEVHREDVPFGTSRFAFELGSVLGQRTFVEVATVTLVENGVALFPDAPSPRATRQLRSLTRGVQQGQMSAAVVFVVPRVDARAVMAARPIDPEYTDALREAQASGVRLLARRCQVTLEELVLGVPLDVTVPGPPTGRST